MTASCVPGIYLSEQPSEARKVSVLQLGKLRPRVLADVYEVTQLVGSKTGRHGSWNCPTS